MDDIQKGLLTARFNDMSNGCLAFYAIYPDIPNKELWLKSTLELSYGDANALISAIESKDSEISNDSDKIQQDYIIARNEEYARRGVTRDAIMEAQWEKDMEGRPEKADALQVIRLEVKALIPKPE